jgi:ATP-dependent Clp protease ATP-binding subunit ClpC
MTQYRYSDRAIRSLALARNEAVILNHLCIGTEHVLLGLLQESLGTAAKTLHAMDVNRERVFEKVKVILGRGDKPTKGLIPFTLRTKRVIQLAQSESVERGTKYVGTEHLLLGLLREGDGLAVTILKEMRVDLGLLRQRAASVR